MTEARARGPGRILAMLLACAVFPGAAPAAGLKTRATVQATVRLTDSTEVTGMLLDIDRQGVRMDPDGPVSLRVVDGPTIARVEIPVLGIAVVYPPTDEALLDVDRAIRLMPELRTRRADRPARTGSPFHGFRLLSIELGAGATKASASEDASYYQGYNSGRSIHGGIRILFGRKGDLRRSRPFVGVQLSNTHLGVDQPVLSTEDGSGNTLVLEFDDLTVNRVTLEAGITTRILKEDSYVYAAAGLSALDNGATVTGTLLSPGGPPSGVRVAVQDSRTALRLGFGSVIGLGHRLGLDLEASADLLFGALEQIPGYNQSVPSYHGALVGLAAGMVWEL